MSTVYVIGAGASFGESLERLDNLPNEVLSTLTPHQPPLTNGFFNSYLLNAVGYKNAERDCPGLIDYISRAKLLDDAFGEGGWKNLNLEELFTALEVEREFHSPQSDEGARLLLVRNELVRYIRRIIGRCTRYTYGTYYRKLADAENLDVNDSVITLNWDLLLELGPPFRPGVYQWSETL